MQPIIRLGGADAKELPQDDLERISFQVDQDEEQFVRILREGAGATRARPTLARLTRGGSIHRVSAGVGPLEGGQQFTKLGVGQAGKRQKRPRLAGQRLVGHHTAIILFPKKSNHVTKGKLRGPPFRIPGKRRCPGSQTEGRGTSDDLESGVIS